MTLVIFPPLTLTRTRTSPYWLLAAAPVAVFVLVLARLVVLVRLVEAETVAAAVLGCVAAVGVELGVAASFPAAFRPQRSSA